MATLNECREEVRSIIKELQEIEDGVRRDFVNIGQDLCGDCIRKIGVKYVVVLTKLNNVNYNRIASRLTGGN